MYLQISPLWNLILFLAFLIVVEAIIFLSRYKKCPKDKVMVIFGSVGRNKDGSIRTHVCVQNGGKFIWPFIQSYIFLDLKPIPLTIDFNFDEVKEWLGKDNYEVRVRISTEPDILNNAAERLLGLEINEIQELASNIIRGQLYLAMKENKMFDYHVSLNLKKNIEAEINKIGLTIVS